MYVALREVTYNLHGCMVYTELAWLYDVHRTCAKMAAVLCGTSYASAVSTPLWWILKKNAL